MTFRPGEVGLECCEFPVGVTKYELVRDDWNSKQAKATIDSSFDLFQKLTVNYSLFSESKKKDQTPQVGIKLTTYICFFLGGSFQKESVKNCHATWRIIISAILAVGFKCSSFIFTPGQIIQFDKQHSFQMGWFHNHLALHRVSSYLPAISTVVCIDWNVRQRPRNSMGVRNGLRTSQKTTFGEEWRDDIFRNQSLYHRFLVVGRDGNWMSYMIFTRCYQFF